MYIICEMLKLLSVELSTQPYDNKYMFHETSKWFFFVTGKVTTDLQFRYCSCS